VMTPLPLELWTFFDEGRLEPFRKEPAGAEVAPITEDYTPAKDLKSLPTSRELYDGLLDAPTSRASPTLTSSCPRSTF
jgi:hypothetical protein